ncbi:uncharacterized protein OCT59_023315 [Rhizophagus irregularis]|uniref:uncharacterized protein n=1 Tax=Rhizophagus irregularis TaxID=588596 RepID=UPI003333203F|nr:hypothetical protein OCT59_023315 [Rhizophagus irregularis]
MTRRRSVSSILGNQKKNEHRRSFQNPRKRKKVPCYCNNCNGKLVLKRTKLLHETGGEMNDSNEDESSEDEALSIIQETSEQDITENIELLQVNVDVHQTSTSGSDFGRYTKVKGYKYPGT